MTMPTPQKIGKYAERLVAAARGLDAEPDNMKAREAYMRAAFNLDWTATAVVSLADALDAERTSHAELQARAGAPDDGRWLTRMYEIRQASGIGFRPMLSEVPAAIKARIDALEARATTAETALAQAREALEPFARVAEVDIGESEADDDTFRNSARAYARAPAITVGDIRRARAALNPGGDHG